VKLNKAEIMNYQQQLNSIHSYLMYKKFPYHSLSVIHRHQDLGFHVFFSDDVKEMVTDEIKEHLAAYAFHWSFVKSN
jgi:hypothetical protein